ncbi:aminodeoxychorismate synthase, component I [Vibrio sp. 10N.286.49.C2]|uniref:aminodeoxychorismate synthase component I n=2 Tax=Vibrio TaxID=662 RepID=UPI000C860711|nr:MULTISPECIES: aminodeoxychorismate synthase component I [unclassified Vibrio]PMH40719.1 aminodeoxychorismate synthase, component I [Vibrio sp. 10N.286.49.C2]PMH45250.1 aminodeoxychorismate synthase, component I [Vibrio sp. 10N.286.49.B1]PMH78256.1 aminodeoxychorismate synthase, component I [Vibrio sp. 10N.286.48.B7]
MCATTFLSQFTQMNTKELQPIQFLDVPYQDDLATHYFAAIECNSWSMLLKSSSLDHEDSRFDILVTKPVATLVTHNLNTTITQCVTNQAATVNQTAAAAISTSATTSAMASTSTATTTSKNDPFSLLETAILEHIGHVDSDSHWPFVGGALGYFSYDLGRRVEHLPDLAIQDIDAPEMAVGIYDWALIVDHRDKKAIVVGQNVHQHLAWLQAQVAPITTCFKRTSNWHANMSKSEYSDKFSAVQRYLQAGDCYQINLAQRWQADYEGDEWQAFTQLDQQNKAPFSAFIRLDDIAILSISPERFLLANDKQVQTKPIKGTRPRSQDPLQDEANALELSNASKDQAENLMIVDLLRNDIGRVAKPGSVEVPKLFDIESFPAVHHLVSTITAQLDEQYSALDLLKASFPGGSITGAPKIRAMEIIEELEPHRRHIYCGSIGYISAHGVMDTSITIRTLAAYQGKIHAWAGGGIVADSQCEAEYQETFDKLAKILPVL